jgi:two-component system, OmpR family, phosphate regulon sensor histidine kinase PhoR
VLLIDKNHNIEFINKRLKFWLSLNKINSDEFLNKKDSLFYETFGKLVENKPELAKVTKSVMGKENLVNNALDLEMKTKLYKYLHASTTPIFDEKIGYTGRVWIFEDVTKEKNIDKMKTEFISIASHQLRTPVTIIRGYLSMLTDGSYLIEDKEVKEYVEAAKQGSDRLVELIEDLLNISKIETDKLKVSREKEEVKKVLEEILMVHTNAMVEKNIIFEKKYNISNQDTFLIDLKMLINIVNNLVENAIKYTPQGGKIAIRVDILENEKRTLCISIKDTGVGIPEEEQEKVFEKFFRAKNVKDSDFTGTGIGLYYVTRLLELLNGKITFSSKLGEGTEFTFEIPEA